MISIPTTRPCTWATKACSSSPSWRSTERDRVYVNTHTCVDRAAWIHMKRRSNYQLWSCSSDSWGVSQREKPVRLNSHQAARWHTFHTPRLFQHNHRHCPKLSCFHLTSQRGAARCQPWCVPLVLVTIIHTEVYSERVRGGGVKQEEETLNLSCV